LQDLYAIGTAWPGGNAKDSTFLFLKIHYFTHCLSEGVELDTVVRLNLSVAIGEAIVLSKLAEPFRFADAQKATVISSVNLDQTPYLVSLFLQTQLGSLPAFGFSLLSSPGIKSSRPIYQTKGCR